MIKEGNAIVKKIEAYSHANHHLPNNIEDIGIKETLQGPFYYEKVDSTYYMIWFGTSVGEAVYYYSDTKTWEPQERGVGPDNK
jgi:hypothetical protein